MREEEEKQRGQKSACLRSRRPYNIEYHTNVRTDSVQLYGQPRGSVVVLHHMHVQQQNSRRTSPSRSKANPARHSLRSVAGSTFAAARAARPPLSPLSSLVAEGNCSGTLSAAVVISGAEGYLHRAAKTIA